MKHTAGVWGCGRGVWTLNTHISSEGPGMPTTRPKTGILFVIIVYKEIIQIVFKHTDDVINHIYG